VSVSIERDGVYDGAEAENREQVGYFLDRLHDIAENPEEFAALYPDQSSDPGLMPILTQAENHLAHVTYSFQVAADSDDFPYELRRTEAYPEQPTSRALDKATYFTEVVLDDGEPAEWRREELPESYKVEAKAEEQAAMDRLLSDPLAVYDEFNKRRTEGGMEALFPEFGATLKTLYYDLVNKQQVLAACDLSPATSKMRDRVIRNVQDKIDEGTFGYTSTLDLIEDTVAFFDVVARVNEPDSPPIYHTKRFEYDWHTLPREDDYFVLPSTAGLTAFDLLKVRGVPIGIVGASTDTLTVDGRPQTPYEFFHHDVNHTRRLYEELLLGAEREGVSMRKYCEDATKLIHETLLPAVDLEGIAAGEEWDRRVAMRMILFEILHEDAYDPTRDTIADAIMRTPGERMPFEATDGTVVEHFMGERATVLAHVFRKLSGNFFDLPGRRSTTLGSDFARTRLAIAQGAADLYRLVSDDQISQEDLLATCRDLVSTDEYFTDAFIGNMANIINADGSGKNRLKMGVVKPLGVISAIRKAREHGMQVHALFGYSLLEYEDPDGLVDAVVEDLEALDPEETAIAIGATPYGIGRLYPVIKELGFHTLGIVASTAVGRNEEVTDGVDELVVVKDQGWGGYRYEQRASGLLSPTTRTFLGASDSIAAYGGGNITAVSIAKMRERGKPVTYRPFDMNHRIADMLNAQKGVEGPVDYHGPAYAVARDLGLLAVR